MTGKTLRTSLVSALVLMAATPVFADVKTGVDAWTHGDYATAVREWQGPAASGDADAQFNLAQAYKLGRGVKQDLVKAEELFGKAATQGHLQASDNYGLLLFQRGQRGQALPYIRAAADRGDPRAQYLLGIAHFNGDGVPKDWVRAYALTSLAQQANLAQATTALAQMNQHIPLDQRQQGVALAAELAEQTRATRARQMAAADLGSNVPSTATPPPAAAVRPPVIAAAPPPPRPVIARNDGAAPADSPRNAGADFARPRVNQGVPPAVAASAPRVNTPVASSSNGGAWRVQLGAFGVPANADAMWNKVKNRPEIAGHSKLLVPAGRVLKLQAGGYGSQAEAQAACSRLSAAGISCIAARN